eukprot:GHVT01021895.1.p1 GENE.GHVT01021895.1~~GHVT01021895.1.p1  ORF type:complete len:417 (+),score=99.49 GHVT01021895.1:633-1883(+)
MCPQTFLTFSVEASSMASTIEALRLGNPSLTDRVFVLPTTVERLASAVTDQKLSLTAAVDFFKAQTAEGPEPSAPTAAPAAEGLGKEGGEGGGGGTADVKAEEESADENSLNKVDVIVSEPIGTFLFNERMMETFLLARDMFLKPGGKMFPSKCTLYLAPFSDATLHEDTRQRCSFWNNRDFNGVDLSAAAPRAVYEQFRQPVVDYIDPSILVAHPHAEEFDLATIPRKSLECLTFNFSFPIDRPCLVHGIAGWFDVLFDGSTQTTGFSTSPSSPPTHWYQIRFLLPVPLAINPSQVLVGKIQMKANAQQSYDIHLAVIIQGTDIHAENLRIDLSDPEYRYYSNPSQSYYPNQMAASAAAYSPTFYNAASQQPQQQQQQQQQQHQQPPLPGASVSSLPPETIPNDGLHVVTSKPRL